MTISNNDITRTTTVTVTVTVTGASASSGRSYIFNRYKIRSLSIKLAKCALTMFQFMDFSLFTENQRLIAIIDTIEIPTHIYFGN